MKSLLTSAMACLIILMSSTSHASNLRLVSHWAYTKNETILFLNNGSVVKEYEPLHCPVEEVKAIIMSEDPSIRLRGERLRDNLDIAFYSKIHRKSLVCEFRAII